MNAGRSSESSWPAVILAADHRARAVVTIEDYRAYVDALRAALVHCDGVLASVQPLGDLVAEGAVRPGQRTYLSINRTGLAGSTFEMDDRLVASVERAAEEGHDGIKHLVRIDLTDRETARGLELLGEVLEAARRNGMEALIEPLAWRQGQMSRQVDDIVMAAVVAHDLGSPVLKVPVPDETPGVRRVAAVRRIVASVGVPVLFLGGPHRLGGDTDLLEEVRDAMAGGGAGMAIGRAVYQEADPERMAREVAAIVHGPPAGVRAAGE